jgi:hypothetical protein
VVHSALRTPKHDSGLANPALTHFNVLTRLSANAGERLLCGEHVVNVCAWTRPNAVFDFVEIDT